MRYIDDKDFICTYHKIILENSKRILKFLDTDDDISEELIQEIIVCAKHAMKAGRRMERRLHEYRDSIERLGYKRV